MDSIDMLLAMAYTHAIDMHGVQLSETHRLASSPNRHFDPPLEVRGVQNEVCSSFTRSFPTTQSNRSYSLVPFYMQKNKETGEYEVIQANATL